MFLIIIKWFYNWITKELCLPEMTSSYLDTISLTRLKKSRNLKRLNST